MIVVVDYGMGNLGSIANMLKKVGTAATVSEDPNVIARADKLILPGVGAFDAGIQELKTRGLDGLLTRKVVSESTPILGICLGAQLMTRRSEEGTQPGLGWIDADTVRFRHDVGSSLKIPHMGWNTIEPKKESPICREMYAGARYYFVHSYHVVCERGGDVLAVTRYGSEFVSAFQKGNIFGVQFHPEKSHKFGMKLFENFAML